jgi:hypothetical protein
VSDRKQKRHTHTHTHTHTQVKNFDKKALSKDGAFVSVDDQSIILPDGTLEESGLLFRNEFHFHPLAKVPPTSSHSSLRLADCLSFFRLASQSSSPLHDASRAQ